MLIGLPQTSRACYNSLPTGYLRILGVQPGSYQKAVLMSLAALVLLAAGVLISVPVRAQARNLLAATPAPRGVILFEDDFVTYSGRWQEKTSPKASVLYGEAVLNVRVVSPGVFAWSVPDFDTILRDHRVEVTVDFRGGSADSRFGFVLDYRDDEHFYALLTTLPGEWQFLRRQGIEWVDLTPPDAASLAQEADGALIRLRVDVVGDTLTFWIDGQPAGRVIVGDALSGANFGLIARAGHGYVDVAFDDFVVTVIVGENQES
jgi:hypothetical protein